MLKDHDKFLIKDLEQIEQDKEKEKLRKRKHQESFGYGEGLYISSDDEDEEIAANKQANRLSNLRSKLRKTPRD